jgi:hypothetical protein
VDGIDRSPIRSERYPELNRAPTQLNDHPRDHSAQKTDGSTDITRRHPRAEAIIETFSVSENALTHEGLSAALRALESFTAKQLPLIGTSANELEGIQTVSMPGREKSQVLVTLPAHPGWMVLAVDNGHHRGFRLEVFGPDAYEATIARTPANINRAEAVRIAAQMVTERASER